MTTKNRMKEVIEYIQKNHDRHIGELNEFLRIPSVSTDPEHKEAVKTAAAFVAKQLQEAGMTTVKIFPTEGHPIVYAEQLSLLPPALKLLHSSAEYPVKYSKELVEIQKELEKEHV